MEPSKHKLMAFEELAQRYEHLIEAGVYKNGDHLPSVREIAYSERLNPNTVARAFQKVCEDGYAYSLEKKGYFVSYKASYNPLVKTMVSLLKQYNKEEILEAVEIAGKERDDQN